MGRPRAATPPLRPEVAHGAATGTRVPRRVRPVLQHAVMLAVAVPFVLPFYWMATSALKSPMEILARPILLWPTTVRWENFAEALTFEGFPFLLFLRNSVVYAGLVTIGTVVSCSAIGYGFARLRFPGRNALFMITVATMMLPSFVTFIPTYVLFKYLGLLGTYAPLILPSYLGSGFFIFLMRQFYLGLPWELSESAKVDGAGEFRIFWQIMLPLVRPALMAAGVFTFLWTWNDFFGPLIYIGDAQLFPLSVGLSVFRQRYVERWDLLMAASTITTVPVICLFFLAQRSFLEGIKLTGIKG